MESHEGRRLRRGGRSRGRSGVRSHKSFAIVIPHSAFHEYEHFVNKEWRDPHLTKNLWIGRFRVLERAEPVLGIDWRARMQPTHIVSRALYENNWMITVRALSLYEIEVICGLTDPF